MLLGETSPPPEQHTEFDTTQVTAEMTEHDHSGHTTFVDWVSDNVVISGAIGVSFSAVVAALIWVLKRWASNKWPKRTDDG